MFVPDLEHPAAILYLERMVSCRPEVAERAAFHFLFPVDRPPRELSERLQGDVRARVFLKAGCDLKPKEMLDVVLNETG